MTLVLQLLHGRILETDQPEEWGFDGPAIEIDCFGFTYENLWYTDKAGNRHDLILHHDLVFYAGKYYGDFHVYNRE